MNKCICLFNTNQTIRSYHIKAKLKLLSTKLGLSPAKAIPEC